MERFDPKRWRPILVSLASRIRPYRLKHSQEDFDDLMALGMAAAWRAHKSYDPSRGELSSWVWFLARSAMLKHLKFLDYPAVSFDDLVASDENSGDLECYRRRCVPSFEPDADARMDAAALLGGCSRAR